MTTSKKATAGFTPKRQRTKGIDWDSAPLGKFQDTEMACRYGVATSVVCNARNRRGILPHTPRLAPVDWDAAPLGDFPDAVIAEKVGVSQPTVTRHRNAKGIHPFKATFLTSEGQAAYSYGEAVLDLYWHEQGTPHKFQVRVGKYIADWVIDGDTIVEYAGFVDSRIFGPAYKIRLDAKVAYFMQSGWKVLVVYPDKLYMYPIKGSLITTRDVVSTNGINWSQQPLGQIQDTVLAGHLNVAPWEVSRRRKQLGIQKHSTLPDWSTVPLGQEPDATFAHRFGTCKETVRKARVALGISSYRSVHHAA